MTTHPDLGALEPTAPNRSVPGVDFDHMLVSNRHGMYCLPTDFADREIGQLLVRGRVYEPEMLHFLCARAGTGDMVTGGAFIGDFLPALSQAIAPDARIHTFEPHPVSFAAAQVTLRLNRCRNVALHPVAVGERASMLPLQVARAGGEVQIAAGSRIVEAPRPHEETIDVPVMTIDSLVPARRKVGLLHLDVEGFEAQALAGAQRVIGDDHPLVVLEADRQTIRLSHLEMLQTIAPDAQYRIAGVIEKNTIFVPVAGL